MRNPLSNPLHPWHRSRSRVSSFVATVLPVGVMALAHAGEGSGAGSPSQIHPSLVLQGPFSGGAFGVSVAPAFDVNADGYADLLVGDPLGEGTSGAEPGEGVARCYLGSVNGLVSTAAWTRVGGSRDVSFGETLTGAGDVNGDGYGDVLVAAPNWSGSIPFEGQVRLYLGSHSGLKTTPIWTFVSGQEQAHIGSFLAPLGDVNGDGHADIGLADSQFSLACAFYGSSTGLPATPSWTFPSHGEGKGGMIGVGDVNEDGYDDVLIGGATGAGGNAAAWLFLGSPNGLQITPTTTILGPTGGCTYRVAAGGDVQGDGRPDGLLGDELEKTVHVLQGTSSGVAFFGPTVSSPILPIDFPSALAGGGDFDRDGFDDVLVTDVAVAQAWVFRGASTGLDPSAAQRAEPDPAFTGSDPAFGSAVTWVGDLDADGDCDLAVGDPHGVSSLHTAPNADGVVYVFDGLPLNASVPTRFVPGDRLEGTVFGIGGSTIAAFDGVKGMKLQLAFDASSVNSKLKLRLIDPKGKVEEELSVKLGGKVANQTFKLKRSGLYALRIESKVAGPTSIGIATGRILPKTALNQKKEYKFNSNSSTAEVDVSALPGAMLWGSAIATTKYSSFESLHASLEKPGGGELGLDFEFDIGSYDIDDQKLNTAGRYKLRFTAITSSQVKMKLSLKLTQPPLGSSIVQLP